jgi:hypothetical protein
MTHPIIKTENYLLVVDKLNCPAKEGQTFLTKEGLIHTNIGWNYGDSVIIYHLPLNNAPILEGVPLLPPLEDDFVELAKKYGISIGDKAGTSAFDFMRGYDKAKKKYKYTEDDLRFAIKSAFMQGVERVPYLHQLEDNIIKALQQPKYPVAFECEMEFIDNQDFMDFEEDAATLPSSIESTEQPKTITNSQGLIQVVGKYIY